jgi:excisionase family DNA binding protein
MRKTVYDNEVYLAPAQVASMFGVDPKTVARWVKGGKLEGVRVFMTPGGHRRYSESDLERLRNVADAGAGR